MRCREPSSITDTEYLSVFGNLEGLNLKILFDLREKKDHYTAENMNGWKYLQRNYLANPI